MTILRRFAVVAALLALSAIVSACGGDDPGDPAATVQELFEASVEGDGETACALTTEEAQQNLIEEAADSGLSCEEAVAALPEAYPDDFEIGEPEVVEEDDESATVSVTLSGGGSEQEEELGLVVEDGQWKVTGDAE